MRGDDAAAAPHSGAMRGIETLLFQTGAIRVAPDERPFWYTAGTLGPFYCNTHYLFGGEAAANELLASIDGALALDDRTPLPHAVATLVGRRYACGGAYREAVDTMAGYLSANVDMDGIGAISGGERRDWFFSYAAAARFGKAHLTLFKDKSALFSEASHSGGGARRARAATAADLAGKRVLHVCDLITEASSFKRAWAPALDRLGARISESLAIVDRMQGGGDALASLGIRSHALARIDAGLFGRALEAGVIDARQHGLLLRYIEDPHGTMREFLSRRPRFIADAIASGGKDAERARLCVEAGIYAGT